MYSRLMPSVLILSATLTAQSFVTVYTTTNDPTDNELAVAMRLPCGELMPLGQFSTGGEGTGGGLGSQGALATTENNRWLLAVNAGSDEVTVFRTYCGSVPRRTDVVDSGGDMPTSVAVHDDLVYVLNAGTGNNVRGFHLDDGELEPIDGATYALSQEGAMPAQVGFDPDGRFLLVTERATDRILVFRVECDGTLGPIQVHDSAGSTPFGFQFARHDTLVVSEAAGGAPGASTVSSYRLSSCGDLNVVTSAEPTMQTAACWIAVPRRGEFAYTTNTGSGTLTGFAVRRHGRLRLLDSDGVTGTLEAGGSPIDADFDRCGRLLFVLDAGRDEVAVLRRNSDGELRLLSETWSLPDGAVGLIAR